MSGGSNSSGYLFTGTFHLLEPMLLVSLDPRQIKNSNAFSYENTSLQSNIFLLKYDGKLFDVAWNSINVGKAVLNYGHAKCAGMVLEQYLSAWCDGGVISVPHQSWAWLDL